MEMPNRPDIDANYKNLQDFVEVVREEEIPFDDIKKKDDLGTFYGNRAQRRKQRQAFKRTIKQLRKGKSKND